MRGEDERGKQEIKARLRVSIFVIRGRLLCSPESSQPEKKERRQLVSSLFQQLGNKFRSRLYPKLFVFFVVLNLYLTR